jgi:hypothetical protein
VLSGGLTGVARGFFGLLMMRSITALAPSNPNTLYEGGLVWSLVFLAVGVAVLVLNTVRAAELQSCRAAELQSCLTLARTLTLTTGAQAHRPTPTPTSPCPDY